ncbi:MAG: hypothetical protein EDR02_05260 [Actinobacteria bacterium]|nr:MAG: hypothetical protein EDR02_05260 [Actinomycetota bacterium]
MEPVDDEVHRLAETEAARVALGEPRHQPQPLGQFDHAEPVGHLPPVAGGSGVDRGPAPQRRAVAAYEDLFGRGRPAHLTGRRKRELDRGAVRASSGQQAG